MWHSLDTFRALSLGERAVGTYSVHVTCINCGHGERVEVPKRRLVENQPCERCGCKTLKRSW